jgi:hypothetical protein
MFTGQSLKGPEGSVAFLKLADSAFDVPDPRADQTQQKSAAGRAQGIAFKRGKGRVVVMGEAACLTAQIVTTPNGEYNVRWETLPPGRFRHPDHRFEWTRAEFARWSSAVADRHGYRVRHLPIGPEDPEVGSPTQMAVFER